MRVFKRQTLQWKYAATLSALVSATLLVGGALQAGLAYRQSVAAALAQQQLRAEAAAGEIAGFMARAQRALADTAAKLDAADAGEELLIELAALLRHHPELSELHWVGADGRERLALRRYGIAADGLAHDWSADPRFVQARAAGAWIGPVYFRKASEPYAALAAARGAQSGVLVAELSLRHVRDAAARAWRPADGHTAYVVDRTGLLIVHPDMARVLAHSDLSALPQVKRMLTGNVMQAAGRETGVDGSPVLGAAVRMESLGWTVLAEQPLARALAPVRTTLLNALALLLLGVAAAVAASVWLARQLVRPIREIGEAARRLGEGQGGARIASARQDELGGLAAQFDRMAERVEATQAQQEERIAERTRALAAADAAKSRFLAVASHDLRQPVHALALLAGQLRADTAPGAELLQRIEASTQSLQALVDTLLDLSQIDVGGIKAAPRDFALDELFARLAVQCAGVAEAKSLALRVRPTREWVRSDPLLLERIGLNLLANALRYTEQGGVLLAARRRGARVELLVVDTGIGIAAEHLPNVFDEFYRAAGSSTGLGLGLAIVRRLTALLGHGLAIASTPGRGSCVRVTLALADARAAPPVLEPGPVPVDPLLGRRVLVVDDDAAAREALRGLLVQWGCEVGCAADAASALAEAGRLAPELLLCDLALAEGESGIDVAARLQQARDGSLRCAFITGGPLPEGLGHPVLRKPTPPARLRALLEQLLRAGVQSSSDAASSSGNSTDV